MSEDRSQWFRCRHWVESALPYARGTYTIEDVEDGIARGQFVFWAGERSAIITEVLSYPRKKVLHYFLIGGDLAELQSVLEPVITAWGKSQGCSGVSGTGRPGLERAFAKNGFERAWVTLYKEI